MGHKTTAAVKLTACKVINDTLQVRLKGGKEKKKLEMGQRVEKNDFQGDLSIDGDRNSMEEAISGPT